jgi:hypothetical protein
LLNLTRCDGHLETPVRVVYVSGNVPNDAAVRRQFLPEAFDSAYYPCHDVAMPDRKLIIVRFIGSTPSTAYCDVCKLAFRTPREFVTDAVKAKQQLQSDFEQHECKPEEGAVNEALTHIR